MSSSTHKQQDAQLPLQRDRTVAEVTREHYITVARMFSTSQHGGYRHTRGC